MPDSGLIRSPLANRLKRHSRMATLVRPASLFSDGPLHAPAEAPAGVVQARPMLVEDAPLADRTVPAQAGINAGKAAAPAVQPARPPASPTGLPPARVAPPGASPVVAQRAPVAQNTPASTLSPTPGGDEEENKGPWRRLQAIFNRHQDSVEEDLVSPPPVDGAPPAGHSPSEGPDRARASAQPVVQRAVRPSQNTSSLPEEELPTQPSAGSAPSPASQPAGTQPEAPFQAAQNLSTPPAPDQPQGSMPLQSLSPAEPQLARPQEASASAPSSVEPGLPAPQGIGQPESQRRGEGIQSAAAVGGEETGQGEAPARPQPPSPQGRLPETPAPAVPTAQASGSEEAFQPAAAGGEPLNPLPLEEAWPVQRRAVPTVRRSIDPPAVPQPVPASSLPAVEPFVQALSGVRPGQPTESAIEFVPPRKARPVEVQRRESAAPQPGSAPPPPQPHPAEPSSALPGPDEPPETEFVQRLSDETHPRQSLPLQARQEAPPDVDTEIGALPADLWAIIGEKPPRPQPAAREPEGEPGQAPALPPPGPGRVAQRAVEIESVSAEAAPPQAAEPAAPPPAAPPAPQGGVNLEELARQVYAEIRRRLAVEREWFRGDR